MRTLLFFLIFGLSLTGFAQVDNDNRSFAIPLPETPPAPKNTSKPIELPTTIKDLDEKQQPLIIEKNPISMTPRNEFVNPHKDLEDDLNKRGEGNQYKALRKNMHLGNFQTSSPYLIIHYRDFGAIDGDRIQLSNNDQVLLASDYLEGYFKKFRIDLADGINNIAILALNEGSLFPNTAQYEIYDASGNLISANSWNLSTNFKAYLVVIKEQ